MQNQLIFVSGAGNVISCWRKQVRPDIIEKQAQQLTIWSLALFALLFAQDRF
jgi:hypothetical protein